MTTLMTYVNAFRRGEYHTFVDHHDYYEPESKPIRLDINHEGIRGLKTEREAKPNEVGIAGILEKIN